jgi:hypothetical protein
MHVYSRAPDDFAVVAYVLAAETTPQSIPHRLTECVALHRKPSERIWSELVELLFESSQHSLQSALVLLCAYVRPSLLVVALAYCAKPPRHTRAHHAYYPHSQP